MADLFDKIKQLVAIRDVRISEHGYDELADDDLTVRDIVDSVESATLVESYPDFPKGPSVLSLQSDQKGNRCT